MTGNWSALLADGDAVELVPPAVDEAPTAASAPAVYAPLPPKPGHGRQYRVRWKRDGRPPRSKVYTYFNAAATFAAQLEREKSNPGRVWNTRRRMHVQKGLVEWVALDMNYVLQYAAEHARPCDCGCGETFLAARNDQRFVDTAHRMRAYRGRRSSLRLAT